MPTSNVMLEIVQPGDRAVVLVAAVETAFGVPGEPAGDGSYVRFQVAMAYPVARQRAVRALFMAGDNQGECVRVM